MDKLLTLEGGTGVPLTSTSTRSPPVAAGVVRGCSRKADVLDVSVIAGMEELAGSNPELGRVVGLVLRDAAAIEGPAAKIKRMNSLGWTMSMGFAMSKA